MAGPSHDVGNQNSAQSLENVMRLHRSGSLVEAEAGYRQFLQDHPDNVEVLLLLGVLVYQTRRNEAAISFLGKAGAETLSIPEVLTRLGRGFTKIGRFDEALYCYRRAAELSPDYAETCRDLITVIRKQEIPLP